MEISYSLGASEQIITKISGSIFVANPIARLILKIFRLFGFINRVELVMTTSGIHSLETGRVLWVVPVVRSRGFARWSHVSTIVGIQSTSFLVFKTNNLLFVLDGTPWIGINLKKSNFQQVEEEVRRVQLLSSCEPDDPALIELIEASQRKLADEESESSSSPSSSADGESSSSAAGLLFLFSIIYAAVESLVVAEVMDYRPWFIYGVTFTSFVMYIILVSQLSIIHLLSIIMLPLLAIDISYLLLESESVFQYLDLSDMYLAFSGSDFDSYIDHLYPEAFPYLHACLIAGVGVFGAIALANAND